MVPIPQESEGTQPSRASLKGDEDLHLSESPRTVADIEAFLSLAVHPSSKLPSPPPLTDALHKDEPLPFAEGTADVTRCARKRRIRVGALSGSGVNDGIRMYQIAYRIYRPELLASEERAPILVLHGGPSLPSQYLQPLAEHFTTRSVILYDQLGCGQSSSPLDLSLYSLAKSIDDLEALVDFLGLRRFHLLGHSFGGVLAYEYCKRVAERVGREESGWRDVPDMLSLVLSNASTSVEQSESERGRLFHEMRAAAASAEIFDDDGWDERFWRLHQCRTPSTPTPLSDALEWWGRIWYETPSVASYSATAPSRWASDLPPAVVLRGEFDFVTESCIRGWRGLWNHDNIREVTMAGCAHYCHLEDGKMYGSIVESFCQEQDP